MVTHYNTLVSWYRGLSWAKVEWPLQAAQPTPEVGGGALSDAHPFGERDEESDSSDDIGFAGIATILRIHG